MKYTHQQLNRVFKALDENTELMGITLNGLPAWPLVKERLWHYLLQGDERHISTRLSKRSLGASLVKGIWQGLRVLWSVKKYKVIFAYAPRYFQLESLETIHPYFGRLLDQHQHDAFNLLYGAMTGEKARLRANCLHEVYCGRFMRLFAELLGWRRKAVRLAKLLSEHVALLLPGVDHKGLYRMCRLALNIYLLKFTFYRKVFKRIQATQMILQDADGKVAEVMAAKSLNIEVIELQHGAFGADDIDYAWSACHRDHRLLMPVPNKLLVFGELWRDIILQKGFYDAQDIHIVRYEAIAQCRQITMHTRKKQSKVYCLLFPTQSHLREQSLQFFHQLLKLQQDSQQMVFHLFIKVHPNEAHALPIYRLLAKRYSQCTVLPLQTNGYLSILRCDIVLGYTSMMLLEAVALQVPVLSLMAKKDSGGFCDIFGFKQMARVIPKFYDADRLYHYLQSMSNLSELNNDIASFSQKISEKTNRKIDEFIKL